MRQSAYWNTLHQYTEQKQTYTNVDILGNVAIDKIDELYRTSLVFVYPTTFPEIDCVSLTKAIINGCYCVHTSAGAMCEKETYGTVCIPSRTHTSTDTNNTNNFELNETEYNDFRNALYETLCTASHTSSSSPNMKNAKETFAITRVARFWHDCIKKYKKNNKSCVKTF